ncbi:putative MFS allantoate transporter, partial [Aureobasidium pullulans]
WSSSNPLLKYSRVPGLFFPCCNFVPLLHFFSVDMSGTEKSYDAEKDLPGPLSDANRNGSLDKSVLQNAGDGDEALKAFASHQGEVIELDEATNKRLLRKIDWNLMPVMCIVYGLNYLDKTTLSYASVMGLRVDTNLTGNNYQWLSSMFYFGYLAWEYPTNRLLQRLPLGKYSAANIILWGATLCTFAAVSDFGGGVAVRFFLGVTEAAVTPGFALLTSQWYTKKEQGSRTSIWFSFNGFAQIFGGLVAYGIAKGTRIHGSAIEPWKIIFLVTGCLTICVGAIFFWVIPDSQLNARFLSKEDRILAIERVRCNQQGIGNKHFKMYQLKEALLDPLTWAFVFYALVADIPNGGISNFFSQLITSFGYTAEESLLYGTPGGAVEVIALLVCGYLGDKFGHRLLISTSGLWISTLGMLLIVCLPLNNNIGRLFGYYLTQASPTPFVALLSLISTNVAGWTKKTTVAALYLIAYCVGNIIGPQTFRPADAPRYIPACIVIIVCYLLCIVDIVFIYWYCKRQNSKRANIRTSPDYVKAENQEWLDLTDRENPEFVYTL